jgi:hypothetical protein
MLTQEELDRLFEEKVQELAEEMREMHYGAREELPQENGFVQCRYMCAHRCGYGLLVVTAPSQVEKAWKRIEKAFRREGWRVSRLGLVCSACANACAVSDRGAPSP